MHPSRSLALVAFLVFGSAGTVLAQRPNSWTEVQLAGTAASASVRQLGKTCTVREGTTLRAFSAFTKRWTDLSSVSLGATLSVYNDIAFVVDSARISAFSAYRGRFESIVVSPAAQVLNPPTQSNDSILVVRDGSTLWTFSAFTGQWLSRTLVAPSPAIAVQRHTLVLGDSGVLAGYSAFRGRWVEVPSADTALNARANGAWGVIEGQTAIHGFSAQHETWSSTAWPSGALQTFAQEDLVLYAGASSAVAYSGLVAQFAITAVPTGATYFSDNLIAAVRSGTQVAFYSAVLGEWLQASASANAVVQVSPQIALVYDLAIGAVAAYSPFTGTLRMAPIRTTTFRANQACAYALSDPNGKPLFFSALVGDWVPAPSEVKPGLPPLTWCGSLLQTTTGYAAFSGRTGNFVSLTTPPGAIPHVDANSSVIALEDANALHVFDARFERWITTPKQQPAPLTVLIWRTTLIAVDGTTVHGFGSLAGEVESIVLAGAPTIAAANSESARVGSGNTLAAFGGASDLTTLYQFPEFRRVFTIGSTLELQLAAEPLSLALLAVGSVQPSPIAYPNIGDWWIDPQGAHYVALALPANELRAVLRFAVPLDPALRGFEPAFQAFVQPPQASLYTTRIASVGLR